MKKLTCEMCGGSDLLKEEGVFACQSCGTKYSVEEARKMMIDGTVEVTGKVSVDNTAKLDNLFKVARRAKDDMNVEQAFKYYEQITLENPNSWEATFYIAFFSAVQKYRKHEIGPPISLIRNCLDSVFDLIENIEDGDEQRAASQEVIEKVNTIASLLLDSIQQDYDSEKEAFDRKYSQAETSVTNMLVKASFNAENKAERSKKQGWVEDMTNLVQYRQKRLVEVIGKRRFDEYWDAHQDEKVKLESEKKSLAELVSVLENEFMTATKETEGYSHMLELKNTVQSLTNEIKSLGLFKGKQKKAIQEKIESINKEIEPIQARIDSNTEDIKVQINQLTSKINEIDNELTRPR